MHSRSRTGEATVTESMQNRELQPPPIATSSSKAVEVLRVWAAPGLPHQLTICRVWNDPGAWGLLLADIARHVAAAYTCEGLSAAETLARIKQFMNAEF